MLSATLKEAGRGAIVGEKTAGAFNGYTEAVSLPNAFARFAVPYMRSVSPAGREYEGLGVDPDVLVRNGAADFIQHRDAVLDKALQLIKDAQPSRQ